MIKSRRMRWAGHVERMEKKKKKKKKKKKIVGRTARGKETVRNTKT
jgi:hypothetical protein